MEDGAEDPPAKHKSLNASTLWDGDGLRDGSLSVTYCVETYRSYQQHEHKRGHASGNEDNKRKTRFSPRLVAYKKKDIHFISSHLGGDSVGDVGLHGGHVFLWVVDRDEEVTGLRRLRVGVPDVGFRIVVQLQPVEQRRRGGGTRRLHRRAVGQGRFLRRRGWGHKQ